MIAELSAYPAYKVSGLPWLGKVPEHWNVERLKARVANVIELTDDRPSDAPYVALEHVESWTGRLRDADPAETFESQVKRFRANDVLLGKLRPYLAKVARPTRDGVCVGEFFVLRPRGREVSAAFLEHLLRSRPVIDAINSTTFGAKMPRADWQAVGAIGLGLPTSEEQTAIVRFLDQADHRIRQCIRAKKKLIALLEEQKQAIVYQAVTRGLDPSVRLKPSGVDWLGDVPEHWEVVRLGSLARERGETNDDGAVTDVLSLLRLRGVIPYDEKGNIGNKRSEDITRYKIVRPNDIVVNCMNVIIGSVGISRHTGCLSPVYYVLVPRSGRADAHYLNSLFQCRAFHKSLVRIGKGILAHRLRIPMELLKCELLPRPPMPEQTAIVQYLTEECRGRDEAIARASREIALLDEYRFRLIADVVTGKLDVRRAAAELPDLSGLSDEPADFGEDTDVEEDGAVDDLDEVGV